MLDALLRFLATNRDVEGWETTAADWLIASTVVAVVIALLMVLLKWVLKQRATGPREKTWSRGRSVTFVLCGLLPVALLVGLVWYLSLDFHTIAGVSGLFKGILIAWVLYTGSMLLAHAAAWRNDMF